MQLPLRVVERAVVVLGQTLLLARVVPTRSLTKVTLGCPSRPTTRILVSGDASWITAMASATDIPTLFTRRIALDVVVDRLDIRQRRRRHLGERGSDWRRQGVRGNPAGRRAAADATGAPTPGVDEQAPTATAAIARAATARMDIDIAGLHVGTVSRVSRVWVRIHRLRRDIGAMACGLVRWKTSYRDARPL